MAQSDPAKTTKQLETEEAKADLHADLTALRADLEALATDVSALGRNQLDKAKASATDLARAGGEMVYDIDQSVTKTIRERPLQSVAAAFGIGYLLAMINRH